MELFERLAYYGQATVLSLFLRDHLKFDEVEAGQLSSIFGGLIYLLPIFAGALADKFGFRKAFSLAFGGLAIGYFLIGSLGMEIFQGVYSNFPVYWILFVILIFTAMAGAFIKPSVLGTVAVTSTHETKSLGYAIYYWLVNTGAAIGPILAFLVRDRIGISSVYLVSAISCALMFITTRIFFKEPSETNSSQDKSLLEIAVNILKVLLNFRFIIFLLLFGLYWMLFWQFFIIVPFYVSDYISPDAPVELIISAGAWTIILLQLPINRLTKKIPTQTAILIGFLMAAACWLLWYFTLLSVGNGKTILMGTEWYTGNLILIAGIVIFSIGEQIQAPRFYEYIADMAPEGQAALFQGYAFLPIAIAWGFGGTLGGWLYQTYSTNMKEPQIIFITLFAIGAVASVGMVIYNYFSSKKKA
ncbi:MAG: MFS transporter [Ignavibacteriaceae bacterium]|nr:MFS transporter [Ignavibacteriaceae bacterium]